MYKSVLRLLHHHVSILLLVVSLGGVSSTVFAQQLQVINPGGGISPEYADGMELSLGYLGDFQMFINNTGHLYGSASKPPNMGYSSVTLRIDGAAGTRIYSRGSYGAQSDFIPVSQSPVTGNGSAGTPWQVVTVMMPAQAVDSGVRLTLTDSYVYPSFRFSRKIEVTGLNAADTARIYWYFDTQTGGSDAGIGYLVPGSIVGTRHPFTLERLQFEYNPALGPLWNHYHSGQYSLPPSMISGTGNLEDIITTTSVDAGLGLQWNVPPGSTSFTSGSDLAYLPAGIFAREAYSPDTIGINKTSRMTITLVNVNTVDSPASFQYFLPAGGFAVATPSNLTNTCTPGGGSVTANGTNIIASNLMLAAKPANANAYICTISLDVIGQSPGQFTPSFNSPDASVGHSQANLPILTVTPTVYSTAQITPQIISRGETALLEIRLFNRDTSGPQNGHNLTFDTYTSVVGLTTPQQVTTTCSHLPTVTVSGSQVTLDQIDLAQAPSDSQPYACSVTLQVTGTQPGGYGFYFSSTSGMAPPDLTPYLEILPGAVATANFEPTFTRTGDIARFEVTINNTGANAESNLNFLYTLNPGMTVASPANLTNSCTGATVNLTASELTVTGLDLPGNSTQSASCRITFDTITSSDGFYYGAFYSPDGSVSSFANGELYAFSTFPSGANLSSEVIPAVIGTGETTEVRVRVNTFENAPLSGLSFQYNLGDPKSLMVPNSVTSTCPGTPSVSLSNYGLTVDNLSLNAAPANGRYECTISFRVKGVIPGQSYVFGNVMSGPWNYVVSVTHPVIIASGFSPPGPPGPGSITAVPSSSTWSLLSMIAALLFIAGWSRYRSGHKLN